MSHTTRNHIVRFLILAGLLLTTALHADAGLIIRVDDLSTGLTPDIEVADGDLDDLFAPAGMVTVAQTILPNGQTVSISAVSVPLTGPGPKLDLVSLAISGPTTGTLRISATNTGFISPLTPDTVFSSAIGGTTDGSISAAAYIDSGDGEFATSTLVHDYGTMFGPDFSDSSTDLLTTPGSPFSMTLVVDVTHDDPFDVTSFDFVMEANDDDIVPEPGTLVLSIAGLAMFSTIYARRRRAGRR